MLRAVAPGASDTDRHHNTHHPEEHKHSTTPLHRDTQKSTNAVYCICWGLHTVLSTERTRSQQNTRSNSTRNLHTRSCSPTAPGTRGAGHAALPFLGTRPPQKCSTVMFHSQHSSNISNMKSYEAIHLVFLISPLI